MKLRVFKKIGSALSALNAVTDILNSADLAGVTNLSFYIVGSAGVASGAVQVEDCHDATYTGTWVAEGSPVTVVATAAKKVVISNDSFGAARVRISTVLAGGTVDIWAIGKG